MSDLTDKYLGDTNPLDFEDELDIQGYFCESNLRRLFPGEDIDMEEAEEAMLETLRDFEDGLKFEKEHLVSLFGECYKAGNETCVPENKLSNLIVDSKNTLQNYLDDLYPYLYEEDRLDKATDALWAYWTDPSNSVEDLIARLTADWPEGSTSLGIF
jgi:hypothetical protein